MAKRVRSFGKLAPPQMPKDPSEQVRHFQTPVTLRLPDTDGNACVSGLATNDMPDKGETDARPQNRTLNYRFIPRIKAQERDSYWRAQNSAIDRALALRMDASWSLLHQLFYDTRSGGYDHRLEN